MYDIKLWSVGQDCIFEASHVSEMQGIIIGRQIAGSELEDTDWFVEMVNKSLSKFDIQTVNSFDEAMEYSKTVMLLKNKGIELIEQFGRQCGSMGIV